uniref:porimin n=1 Tax=Jaculus jaculus TaxID=51337 RepID=UPI001E1B57BD|nr:porimin [Jaculus jaculus]
MGVCALGARAVLLLGALQVLEVLGTAADPPGSLNVTSSVSPQNSNGTTTESIVQHVTSNHTSQFNSSTVNPPTTLVSVVLNNVTTVAVKPTTISKMSTPGVSTNMTSTALKSTPNATSVSPNVTQTSTSLVTTAHNSLLTSLTTAIHSKESKGSKFDTGSFVGGIVLTLGVLSILYVGCKVYYSRRGIRYRSIDEHDAII